MNYKKVLAELNEKKGGRPHKHPFVIMKVGQRFKWHDRTIIGSANVRFKPKHWIARAIGDGFNWIIRDK